MGGKRRQQLQGMKETLGNKRLRKTEKRALRGTLNKGAEMRGVAQEITERNHLQQVRSDQIGGRCQF